MPPENLKAESISDLPRIFDEVESLAAELRKEGIPEPTVYEQFKAWSLKPNGELPDVNVEQTAEKFINDLDQIYNALSGDGKTQLDGLITKISGRILAKLKTIHSDIEDDKFKENLKTLLKHSFLSQELGSSFPIFYHRFQHTLEVVERIFDFLSSVTLNNPAVIQDQILAALAHDIFIVVSHGRKTPSGAVTKMPKNEEISNAILQKLLNLDEASSDGVDVGVTTVVPGEGKPGVMIWPRNLIAKIKSVKTKEETGEILAEIGLAIADTGDAISVEQFFNNGLKVWIEEFALASIYSLIHSHAPTLAKDILNKFKQLNSPEEFLSEMQHFFTYNKFSWMQVAFKQNTAYKLKESLLGSLKSFLSFQESIANNFLLNAIEAIDSICTKKDKQGNLILSQVQISQLQEYLDKLKKEYILTRQACAVRAAVINNTNLSFIQILEVLITKNTELSRLCEKFSRIIISSPIRDLPLKSYHQSNVWKNLSGLVSPPHHFTSAMLGNWIKNLSFQEQTTPEDIQRWMTRPPQMTEETEYWLTAAASSSLLKDLTKKIQSLLIPTHINPKICQSNFLALKYKREQKYK